MATDAGRGRIWRTLARDLAKSFGEEGSERSDWTNQQTGVQLTLLESIESARKVGFKTAREVEDSLETGILDNKSNNLTHRINRKIQRNSNAAAKTRTSGEQDSAAAQAQSNVDEAKAAKKSSAGHLKDMQELLSATEPALRKCGTKKIPEPLLVATSSGQVISPPFSVQGRGRIRTFYLLPPFLHPGLSSHFSQLFILSDQARLFPFFQPVEMFHERLLGNESCTPRHRAGSCVGFDLA
ncbi:hypothetical protein DFH07DRAFT_974687 [Mycena maculata]|uniref:Uncharacterized protein n=1 Tax=Mycena maculata TaxID=230809 RepID=A0AAD7H5Q6_9AGAR|nr:hypothetical protein DFH07DRAFT_974824 [Mycena maculata]KAJ7713635.1 hypothetical protein DFH07DRAFT_974687 [Mycena maculata]